MFCYASSALFLYNILKLMTYHTLFYVKLSPFKKVQFFWLTLYKLISLLFVWMLNVFVSVEIYALFVTGQI